MIDYRTNLNKVLSQLDHIKKQVEEERVRLSRESDNLEDVILAQQTLQNIAQNVQQQVLNKIAGVVSKCLGCFDDPYEFKIEFDRKRGKTEARLSFVRNGLETDPLTGSSGGMASVAALGLRIVCLLMSTPRLRKLVVLDEPFKGVSLENQYRVRALLEELSKKMGIQFLITTHDKLFQLGKVIQIR